MRGKKKKRKEKGEKVGKGKEGKRMKTSAKNPQMRERNMLNRKEGRK